MSDNTRYVRAELAEGPVSDLPQHPVLKLTTGDVTRATGIEITAGMTIEHRYDTGILDVRVLGRDGTVIADWMTIKL